MAKFSQAFLQGLLQPTYQKGLFEAAKSVGQLPAVLDIQKQEKEAQERMRKVVSGPPTVERIAQIRSMAASMAVTNPERAKALTNAANSMQKQYDALQKQEDQALTGIAQTIASDPSITNITDYVGASELIPKHKQPAVIQQATDLRKIIVSERENEDARTLSPEVLSFIEKNKKILEQNPMFQKHMAVYNKEGDRAVGELLTATKAIREIVTAEVTRQGKAQFSSAAVEAQSTGFINNFIREDSVSEFIFGRDAVEAAREVFADEDLKDDFVKFVGAEYEKNPSIDASVAVKNALDFMGEKYSDKLEFGRLLNVEEGEQLEANREEVIQYLMEKENLSRKDAIRELNARQAQRAMEKSQEAAPQPAAVPTQPPADLFGTGFGMTPPAATPVPTTTPKPTTYVSPAQMRAGLSRTLSDFQRESEERRAAQAGMLSSGGRPTRN
jgi:hypothetical protein